jgi:hypothetical protein
MGSVRKVAATPRQLTISTGRRGLSIRSFDISKGAGSSKNYVIYPDF